MSKARKRRGNLPELEQGKSPKKYKKTPDKESDSQAVEGRSSEGDSGCPTPDKSFNDSKTPKRKKTSPTKSRKAQKTKSLDMYGADDIKSLNISQLLTLGEGNHEVQENVITSDSGGSSDEDEWEEVKMEEKPEIRDPVIPKEGVNITLELPAHNSLKKKKGFDVEAHIKRQINQVKRELQLLMHKVHVLCWIAHQKFVNRVLNSDTLMGVSLSIVSSKNLYPPKYSDLGYLERILKWFHSVIELKENVKNPERTKDLSEQLCHQFSVKSAYSKTHYVFMFIVILRTLGLKARLVMSFQVVPIRPKNIELSGKTNEEEDKKQSLKHTPKTSKSGSKLKNIEGEVKIVKVENENYFNNKDGKASKKESKPSTSKKCDTKTVNKKSKSVNAKDKSKGDSLSAGTASKGVAKRNKNLLEQSDSDEELVSKHFRPSPEKPRSLKIVRKREKNAGESSPGDVLNTSVSSEKGTGVKRESLDQTPKLKSKLAAKRGEAKDKDSNKSVKVVSKARAKKSKLSVAQEQKNKVIEKATRSSDSDGDFVPQSLKKKEKTEKASLDRRVFSSDEEEETNKKKGVDVWTEVFLEAEEKWISVDAIRQKVHCVNELHSRATQPVVYVVACNNDSTLKDVTKRYVPNWHSDTRKRRVDEAWWNETMWPYQGPRTAQDREEDEDINRQLQDKPLPTVIAEYKDHPLYALKRHLLKFEGIYPPDAPALGFIRGEPVYARECVHTLRSREVWFKEARVVRLREEPYKIVKARPKFDKMSGDVKKDLPLELFGFWQTEEYIPPIATDGKVPRNEYGNVDLFKPCMLPKGTVYLQIPGLNKIAKKLGIDCAPAVTGFEFHMRASHPVVDGFVVCEEFKDVLLDAWNKEIDESNRKSEEKRLKRIYDNWKRLIRGLRIRERLKVKYSFGEEEPKPGASSQKNAKKSV
ncbi:UNVERIFIED_CONTAM: hypothetical protein PYX00_005958 [Menopon gallinae]|uniref:Uncharacterized protein n=1 Tax=Menopon gallinae TaxID=328185 RepID=A0AAW2HUQ2_9NEOP